MQANSETGASKKEGKRGGPFFFRPRVLRSVGAEHFDRTNKTRDLTSGLFIKTSSGDLIDEEQGK